MIVGPSRLLHLLRERPVDGADAVLRAITMIESLDSINTRLVDAMYLLELAHSRSLDVIEFKTCIEGAHAIMQCAFMGVEKAPEEVEEFLARMRARAVIHDAMNGPKK